MKRHLEIYTIVCLLAGGPAARLTIAAPLPVRSVQKDASGVTMKLGPGLLRLEVCDDRTIHITSSPKGRFGIPFSSPFLPVVFLIYRKIFVCLIEAPRIPGCFLAAPCYSALAWKNRTAIKQLISAP